MAFTVKDRLWTTDGIRLVIKGPAFRRSGKKFSIAQPFVRIGRFAGIDIPIDDPEVSRWHLYLQRMPEGIFFVDLGSRTGLIYRGKPCAHGWLTAGEPLQMAGYTLEVAEGKDSPHEPLGRLENESDTLLPVTLTFQTEDGRTTNHPLTRRLTLLGRSAPSNLRLSDPTIAKAHLGIYRTATDAWVVNLVGASAFHDGQPFVAVALRDLDRFELGSFQIVAHLGAAADSADPENRPESGDSILTADFVTGRAHSSEDSSVRPLPTDDSEVALDFGATALADDSDRDLADAHRTDSPFEVPTSHAAFAPRPEDLPLATELQEEVARLREEVERLRAHSKESLDSQRQFSAEHQLLLGENQSLRSRLEAIAQELTQKEAESHDWQARLGELDQLQEQAASFSSVVEERDTLLEQVRRLEQQLLLLREETPLEDRDLERERLIAELETLRTSSRATQELAEESQKNEAELRRQLEAERVSLRETAEEMDGLRQQIATALEQRDKLREQIEVLENDLAERDQLQQQVQDLLARLATAEAETLAARTGAEETVQALEQHWEEERQRLLTEWEAKLNAIRDESEQSRAQLALEVEERSHSMEQAFAAEKDQWTREWEERLARTTAEEETRKKETLEQLAERDRNIARMKQNQLKATELITDRNRQLAELKSRCESLEVERSQLLIRTGELSQRLETHASAEQTSAGLLASQTATISALEGQLRLATEESDRLRRRLEELQNSSIGGPEDAISRASEARIAELERIVNDKVRRSELEHQRLLDELAVSQSDLNAMSKEVQSLTERLRHSQGPLAEANLRVAETPRRSPDAVAPSREVSAATEAAAPREDSEGGGRVQSKVAATLLNRAETLEQRRQMILSLGWVLASFIALITLCIAVVYWLL